MGGLMSVTGQAEGQEGAGPQKVGVALSDILTGLYTTIGALSALAMRDKTGKGQHVDMALLDVTVASMANQAMNFLISGNSPTMMGNAHPNIVPYAAYRAADDYIILAIGNDGQFQRFCEVANRPDIADDRRFSKNRDRVRHREVLSELIHKIIGSKPRAFWLDELQKVGVPCGPINNLQQIFDDPHVKIRGVQQALKHPVAGNLPTVANPIKFSDWRIGYDQAPPSLGQHTNEILKNLLNFDDEKILELKRKNVL